MMKAAPLNCHLCRRRIARDRLHLIAPGTDPPQILCSLCFGHRQTHALLYPGCIHRWHDAADHGVVFASRAGAHRYARQDGSGLVG
jgi:hypothetical protein